MKTQDSQEVIHEIAVLTATRKRSYRKDAQIRDYVPLLAAKRVRETLRAASKISH
ncbi:DUF3562 domain-containing protein [Paraburkholderia hospita]|jgi:hypothetical protein|uniref:DUF3562 domain-containing protein n=1 Tax=Paraburkholderia hospita TaxID=169430 RepID=UPI003ECC50DC